MTQLDDDPRDLVVLRQVGGPELPPTVNRRLVVDLTETTRGDLVWLRAVQGWNKTVLANRSIQLYRRVVEWQNKGGTVTFEGPDGQVEKLIIL